jgi:phage-related protein
MTLNFTSQRPIVWVGDSRRNLRNFPDDAKKLLGHELYLIQSGGMPKDAKPLKGIGSGVVEIALRYASDAFRVVLALQIASGFMFCTPFRKNRRKASPPRNARLT